MPDITNPRIYVLRNTVNMHWNVKDLMKYIIQKCKRYLL